MESDSFIKTNTRNTFPIQLVILYSVYCYLIQMGNSAFIKQFNF